MERVCKNFGSGEIISLGLRTKKKYIQIAIIGFPVKCAKIMRCLVQRSLTTCDDVNRQPRLLRMLRCIVFIDNIVKTTRCTNPKVVVISRHMAALTLQGSSASTDWQTTKRTVRERTAFLFNNSLMSDITFVLPDPDGTQVRVPAHKLVLAISSPVFEAMFYGGLAEKTREIELPDTELPYLLEFLRFLYCDEVDLTANNVFHVLYIAMKYIVPTLETKCRVFLEENIDLSYACQILEEARRLQETALEQRYWKVLDESTPECVKSDRVLSLSHGTLIALLKRDTLMVKEIELFEAVKRWAEANCEDRTAMRAALGDAVHLIRFPAMAPKEFAARVVPTGILTSDEALDLQQYFHGVVRGTVVRYFSTGRKGTFKTSVRCSRFTTNTSGKSSGLSEVTETLTFQTDKMVMFTGICLYGGRKTERKIHVEVKITAPDQTLLTTERGIHEVGSLENGYGFDVIFRAPVLVPPSSKYRISATVKSTDGDSVLINNRAPELLVNLGDVTVSFEKTYGVARQILSLLFET